MAERSERCLLIGGSADGEWHDIKVEHRIRETYRIPRPVSRTDNVLTVEDLVNAAPPATYDTYRAEQMHGEGRVWTIFVEHSLSMPEAMERLLTFYWPPGRQTEVQRRGGERETRG
jgi:hypothetical protein